MHKRPASSSISLGEFILETIATLLSCGSKTLRDRSYRPESELAVVVFVCFVVGLIVLIAYWTS